MLCATVHIYQKLAGLLTHTHTHTHTQFTFLSANCSKWETEDREGGRGQEEAGRRQGGGGAMLRFRFGRLVILRFSTMIGWNCFTTLLHRVVRHGYCTCTFATELTCPQLFAKFRGASRTSIFRCQIAYLLRKMRTGWQVCHRCGHTAATYLKVCDTWVEKRHRRLWIWKIHWNTRHKRQRRWKPLWQSPDIMKVRSRIAQYLESNCTV